jgi:hypothetical protein
MTMEKGVLNCLQAGERPLHQKTGPGWLTGPCGVATKTLQKETSKFPTLSGKNRETRDLAPRNG